MQKKKSDTKHFSCCSLKKNRNSHLFVYSDVEDIELQVLNTNSIMSNTLVEMPFGSLQSDVEEPLSVQQSSSLRETSSVAATAPTITLDEQQHCDIKVDVHRKGSSASSEPAIVSLDHQPEKDSRTSVIKSTVAFISFYK